MELFQVLHTRRNIKNFLPEPVPQDVLLKLIDATRYAPSGANKNPWRFLVTTDKDALTRLGETARTCNWLASAPAGIAIMADTSSTRYWLEDCCVAAYAIWLTATDLGLGVAWGAMYQSDNPEESERRQKHVRQILSIPDNLVIPMLLAVGFPDPEKPPAERKRVAVDDIICWERYPSGDA
ncbi:MAG: nitroreductase family protein [Dehalococcoidales bacterium]|nr:nitroreductase family protein [Dehalococcoidales bacterium]